MVPDNIDDLPDVTAGEKETFRFLRMTAQPDNDYRCWFKPNIRDLEPDFVLFSKQHGLLVLEVKDWAIDRIRPPQEEPAHLTRLLYVAMTRAKHCLVIPYVQKTDMMKRMRGCLG